MCDERRQLRKFRMDHLDYVEGYRIEPPSLDTLTDKNRELAEKWIASLEAAKGIDPYAEWPSTEVLRLKALLAKSVRVEMVDFPCDRMVLADPERGCRFIVGEDHVVAEWRGDGVAADTVFVEEPALTYLKTTTSLDRCVRMVVEMAHWELACAMLAGPGDGKLVEWEEKYRVKGTNDPKVVAEMEKEALDAFDVRKFMDE